VQGAETVVLVQTQELEVATGEQLMQIVINVAEVNEKITTLLSLRQIVPQLFSVQAEPI